MKKTLLSSALLTLVLTAAQSTQAADPVWLEGKTEQSYAIQVYHSPTCGCCKGWVDHLKAHNFKVESIEMHDVTPVKQQFGVPPRGASCHTAVVNGKVIEGHVPAQAIKQLLSAESDIRLLTVPGMPSGGPGMDYEGARKDAFKVYAVNDEGQVSVFKNYQDY